MKRQLRTVAAVAAAAAMTMASVMTASAAGGAVMGVPGDEYSTATGFRDGLRERFPSITDAHIDWAIDIGSSDDPTWDCQYWGTLSSVGKETIAYLVVLGQKDRAWAETQVDYYYIDRDMCVNRGADAAELDALIARLGGNTSASESVQSVPTWKQDNKGWWIERPDGSYLVNEWYQSPESGLWYYMGADGYMLTNTTTPDGYFVNSDGVWVQ